MILKDTYTLLLIGLFSLLLCPEAFSQLAPKKEIKASLTAETIKVDAVFDEPAWGTAVPVSGFTQLEPAPGLASKQKAEVKILFDNKAIYIAATLFDEAPDSILRQVAKRDEAGIADYFGVVLDPYRDGQNGLGFIVTASGVQIDIKYSATGNSSSGAGAVFRGDTNWDAVWDSKVRITAEGWMAEIKIPYSAIRFPNQDKHQWSINFARMIRRHREQSFWNEIKPEEAGLLRQSGILKGIEDIKSPVRLSATPFVAFYANNFYDKNGTPKSQWGKSVNGGMDVKYGINDAFTLDLTLIPDFGEAQSDNQVLNLSPFEIMFDENRPFFTEGTELFNKGGIFYSRRIGGRPLRYFEVRDDLAVKIMPNGEEVALEEIVSNPVTTQLYNATKISGRTTDGLGLGLFNATSARTTAVIRNLETGAERPFETSPLTNYNVLVFDQNLKNNSYVSLINTNVLRSGNAYDANTTGVVLGLNNKANSYALNTGGALSQLYDADSVALGHKAHLALNKTSGQFNFEVGYAEESDTYDPNDLGILFANNSREWWANVNYNIYKPFGAFNNANYGLFTRYSRLYAPGEFTSYGINIWGGVQTKSFINFGVWTYFQPTEERDFFEPRTHDFSRYYRLPAYIDFGGYVSTDYRKKVALDVSTSLTKFSGEGRWSLGVDFAPRFRISDKLFVLLGFSGSLNYKNEGFVANKDDEIIFGIRDIRRYSTSANIDYNFSHNMSFSLRLNHNWATVDYLGLRQLGEDGYLYETQFADHFDTNFNAFNIDAVYRWRFAPGSDLFFIWKNSIFGLSETTGLSYSQNFNLLFEQPQTNSFSLKVVYYLDYLNFVKEK